jgi:hypothetical protein
LFNATANTKVAIFFFDGKNKRRHYDANDNEQSSTSIPSAVSSPGISVLYGFLLDNIFSPPPNAVNLRIVCGAVVLASRFLS